MFLTTILIFNFDISLVLRNALVGFLLTFAVASFSQQVVNPPDTIDPRLIEPEVPKMVFEQTVLDFGKLRVDKAERLTLTIPFTNTGTAALVIQGAETNCGCTTVAFPAKAIKPGKRGKIRITVDAAHQEDLGRFGNIITIYYNAPQRFTRLHAICLFE